MLAKCAEQFSNEPAFWCCELARARRRHGGGPAWPGPLLDARLAGYGAFEPSGVKIKGVKKLSENCQKPEACPLVPLRDGDRETHQACGWCNSRRIELIYDLQEDFWQG